MIKNKDDLKKYYKEQNSKDIIELTQKEIQELVFNSLCLDYYLIGKIKEHINDESYTLSIKDVFDVERFKESLESNLTHSIITVNYDRESTVIINTLEYLYNIFIIDGEYNSQMLFKYISEYLKNNRRIDSEILSDGILINMNQFKED